MNLMETLKVHVLVLIQKEMNVINVGNFCRTNIEFSKALFCRLRLRFLRRIFYC